MSNVNTVTISLEEYEKLKLIELRSDKISDFYLDGERLISLLGRRATFDEIDKVACKMRRLMYDDYYKLKSASAET